MLGSPNAVYFIYDGDGSEYGVPGPAGSAEIERFFSSDFLFRGLPHRQIFTDRSDHAAFHFAAIPYGGLFTGVEGVKTEAEAAIFGGTAGEAYDPCYHAACDDRDNVDEDVLAAMAQSLARAAQYFAIDGSTVPAAP